MSVPDIYKKHDGLWIDLACGSYGPNCVIRYGSDFIGHFYIDASDGVPGLAVLENMLEAYNLRKGYSE